MNNYKNMMTIKILTNSMEDQGREKTANLPKGLALSREIQANNL
jgi:hypothetical protein